MLLVSCTSDKKQKFTTGTIIPMEISSESLGSNLIGENITQKIQVYLPGSYSSSKKDYPVIYYLAGFGGDSSELFSAASSNTSSDLNAIDSSMKDGVISDCIIVGISGINKLGGSFYVNSPVTGNWEDYILEVVDTVDKNFRTIKAPESRGLAGFSMGGFGAVNTGLRNPDVFSYIYAFSPGLFGKSGFDKEVWGTWKHWEPVLDSYGAAFTPDSNLEKLPFASRPNQAMSDIEVFQGWGESWSCGYGDAEGKIKYYKSQSSELLGVKIDYAELDWFNWLISGCKYFHEQLIEAGVDSELQEVKGYSHNIDSVIVKNLMLTYFGSKFN